MPTVVVTGASRGLGRYCAERLAALGHRVIGLARTSPADAPFELRACNVGDAASVKDALADLRRSTDVFALVNAAGIASMNLLVTTPVATIQRIVEVNLLGTIYCCQAVAPIMVAQKSGVIVNTSSTAARTVARGGSLSHYAAAKAAVTHYTRSLAAELGPAGIRVNALAPGVMMTARVKSLAEARGIGLPSEANHVPLRRLGEPEDCAGVVEFLVSDQSRYVTGQCISVCGGATLTPA